MYSVISELCYKGTILQRNDSYNTFVTFYGNKFGNHNMTEVNCEL